MKILVRIVRIPKPFAKVNLWKVSLQKVLSFKFNKKSPMYWKYIFHQNVSSKQPNFFTKVVVLIHLLTCNVYLKGILSSLCSCYEKFKANLSHLSTETRKKKKKNKETNKRKMTRTR